MANGLFTSEDNPSNVLSRNFSDTVQSLENRGRRFYSNIDKLQSGDINLASFGNRVVGDLAAGSFNDLIGLPVSLFADLVTPQSIADPIKEKVAEGVQELSETSTAQDVLKYLEQNPELALDIQAGLEGVSTLVPLKGMNRVAKNMNTEVPYFYSGNPLLKAYGVAKTAAEGAGRAVTSSVSPKYQALDREFGVSQGLLAQTKQFLKAVDERPPLDAKLREARKKVELENEEKNLGLTKTEIAKRSSPENVLTKEELKKYNLAKKGPSYQKGALAYAYLVNKQLGKETDFLDTAFGKQNVLKATNMNKQNFMTALPEDMDSAIKDGIYNHVTKIWGFNPKKFNNTHVIVKNPKAQIDMEGEAFSSGRASATGRFLANHKFKPEELQDKNKAYDLLKTRRLTVGERDLWNKIQRGDKLTDLQQERSKNIIKKVKNTRPARWDEEAQAWFFADSKNSATKELGGTNHMFALKPNGDVTVVISDRHDMLGLDPLGGDALLTMFPPYEINVMTRSKKRPFTDYAEGKKAAEEALEKNYNTPLPQAGKVGTGFTGSTRQAAESILNLKPNVTAADRMNAIMSGAVIGSVPASGMLTNYVERQQGQQ